MRERGEVYRHYGLVHLLLQQQPYFLKGKYTRAFEQYSFFIESEQVEILQEIFGGFEEDAAQLFVLTESSFVFIERRANANKTLYAPATHG